MQRPIWLAILDRCSVGLSAFAWAAVIVRIAPAYFEVTAGLALILGLVAGYVIADFFSGLVHWLADRYFDPKTPVLGPALIAPFREHHADALAMTRHDFFEISGNNSLVTIPLALAILSFPTPTGFPLRVLTASAFGLGLSIIATNHFHCWAHVAHPPPLARRLQNWGLILSPDRHARHHQGDHDNSYCVTSGWLNPVLDRFHVFARLERAVDTLARKSRRAT
jgi:ubiquitin-conjugating enzyme E2 variant